MAGDEPSKKETCVHIGKDADDDVRPNRLCFTYQRVADGVGFPATYGTEFRPFAKRSSFEYTLRKINNGSTTHVDVRGRELLPFG